MKNIEKEETIFIIYTNMKAKEVMIKYNITRRTLSNWVKRGIIEVQLTPTGRYIYIDRNVDKDIDSKL
jgi:predicted site-specific integrase-resolvase